MICIYKYFIINFEERHYKIGGFMSKSIFEVLTRDLDLTNEINNLYKLFSVEKIVQVQYKASEKMKKMSYEELCNDFLVYGNLGTLGFL